MSIGFPLVLFGTERFGESATSYLDFTEQSKVRTGQSIVVTYLCNEPSNGAVKGTLVNTGTHDIKVFAVLTDNNVMCSYGTNATCPKNGFNLYRYNKTVFLGNEVNPFKPKDIANFTTGNYSVQKSIHIVSISGKLFNIPISNTTVSCGR